MKFSPHIRLEGHAAAIYGMCASNRPGCVFTASGDRFVVEWNLIEGKQSGTTIRMEEPAYAVWVDAVKNHLWIGTSGGSIHVIDLLNRTEWRHFKVHSKGVYHFEYNPDQRQLYSSGGDGVVGVFDLENTAWLTQITVGSDKIRQSAWNKSSGGLAVASGDGSIVVFETNFFNETHRFHAHTDGATSLCWHPSKAVLLSGGKDAHLRVWNTSRNFDEITAIPAHHYAIYRIVMNDRGSEFATASRDKTIKWWDAQTLDVLGNSGHAHTHSVNALIYIGDQWVSAGDDRRIQGWRTDAL